MASTSGRWSVVLLHLLQLLLQGFVTEEVLAQPCGPEILRPGLQQLAKFHSGVLINSEEDLPRVPLLLHVTPTCSVSRRGILNSQGMASK